MEGNIEFAPTYKLAKNGTGYDLSRIPGWTDRILYYDKDERLSQWSYDSNNNYLESDHFPVFS